MDTDTIISAAQCRAARALLDWTQDDLADNAQVARATIADFERNTRLPMRQNLISIISALQAAGVAFIAGDEEGAGVRFRKVELEYTKNLVAKDDDLLLRVRYKGNQYAVLLTRDVIDDLGRTNANTPAQRVKIVQGHFPKILLAVESKLMSGKGVGNGQMTLTRNFFPKGTF